MQNWWALVGRRSKLRSKVKFLNFMPFSRLINFVRHCRKTEKKNVASGTQIIAPIKQTDKSLGPVGSVFLIIFYTFSYSQYDTVRYALLMCSLLAAPTSTYGVFTSFSLSQYCCLHIWKIKLVHVGTRILRVKGQAHFTKYYFLWVDAINMQSLSGHYLMRQQVLMVFSLHLVYLSTAACLSEKNKVGSMLAQGVLRVKGQAQITKCYFLWVGVINAQSLSGHYLMRQQVPMVFLLLLVCLGTVANISVDIRAHVGTGIF